MSPDSSCLILIHACGPNVDYLNLRDTVESLVLLNANEVPIQFVFVVDDSSHKEFIVILFKELKLTNLVLEILLNNLSWASNSNHIINKYLNQTKYFLFAHDDLKIETPGYLSTAINFVQKINYPIGWVTFTSTGYYSLKNPVSNSVRSGFFQDRFNFPNIFECSTFKKGQAGNILLPTAPIFCHAPYSHLNLISSTSLEIIGEFPDWTEYTILLDEDQGLRALEKDLPNIWIPSISYIHPLRAPNRKFNGLRYESEAHVSFKQRWGMSDKPYSEHDIEYSLDTYGDLFNWSVGKNSYDWSYVENK